MKWHVVFLGLLTVLISFGGNSAFSLPELDPLRPRVPVNQREGVKQLESPFQKKSPYTYTPESIAEGKKLYQGKGTCVHCHGKLGDGQGPAGKMLTPGPRNFTNCDFQHKRTDGELFWATKFGIPGTGMGPMVPTTLSEEEAWKIIGYLRSFCNM